MVSSMKLAVLAFAVLMAAPGFVQAGVNDTDFTIAFEVRTSAKNMTLETAASPRYDIMSAEITLNRGTLAPCGVRVIHTHNNVDELYYAVSGSVGVAVAFPNGTVQRDVLAPEESFVIPRGLVHTVYNPECSGNAVFLSFLNSFIPGNINVAKAALDINAAAFRPYTAPDLLPSLEEAVGILAYDPVCLARCDLGTTFGQEPASD